MLAQPAWQDYEGRGKGKGYATYKRSQRETREIGDVSTQAIGKRGIWARDTLRVRLRAAPAARTVSPYWLQKAITQLCSSLFPMVYC